MQANATIEHSNSTCLYWCGVSYTPVPAPSKRKMIKLTRCMGALLTTESSYCRPVVSIAHTTQYRPPVGDLQPQVVHILGSALLMRGRPALANTVPIGAVKTPNQ